jgi:hypothetical protein
MLGSAARRISAFRPNPIASLADHGRTLTMRQRKSASPRLETLEPLTLLSGVAAMAPASTTQAEVAPTTTTLGGTARGVFHEHQEGDLLIYDYDIKAAGKLTPIGAATITVALQEFPGAGDDGPEGSLDLITSKGTLTLDMSNSFASPYESGSLPFPTSPRETAVTYKISGGTGAYQDDTGTGVVDFYFSRVRLVKGILNGGVDVKFTTIPKATTTT